MENKMNIRFSPPDVGEAEIEEVIDSNKIRMDYNRTKNKINLSKK